TLSTSFWTILILNCIRSAGLGMGNMPATTTGMNAIPDKVVTQGSAMNNVIRQIFASFGIVFFSIYYEVRKAQVFTQIGRATCCSSDLYVINVILDNPNFELYPQCGSWNGEYACNDDGDECYS